MVDNNNSSFKDENNNQEIIDSQESKQNSSLKRLPKWYKVLLICFIALPFSFMLGPFALVIAIGLLIVLIITFILGIKSLMQIKRSNGTLLSNGYVIPAIITPLVIVLSVAVTMPAIGSAISRSIFMYESWGLSQLGEALTDYAKEHKGQFPEPDKWCDVLKDSNEIDEWVFGRRGDEEKTCDYALNKDAAKLGADAPDNMVLLFDSKPGWNQVGGIELLRKDGSGRINILFADNHKEIVREKNVPYLRWKLEDSGDIPKPDIAKPFTIAGVIVAIVFVWIFAHFRNYAKKYWIFALVLGIVSTGVGMLLGAMAEGALYAIGDEKGIGWTIGGITGFLVGICYVLILGKFFDNKKPEVSSVGYGTLSGLVAGAVCSTIVHSFLMICYEETSFANMLAGLGFGVVAGTILGWISSGIVIKFYAQSQAYEVTPEGSGSNEQ